MGGGQNSVRCGGSNCQISAEHVSEAGMFFKGELSGREEPPTDSEERTFNGLQHCTFRLLFASSP